MALLSMGRIGHVALLRPHTQIVTLARSLAKLIATFFKHSMYISTSYHQPVSHLFRTSLYRSSKAPGSHRRLAQDDHEDPTIKHGTIREEGDRRSFFRIEAGYKSKSLKYERHQKQRGSPWLGWASLIGIR